MKKYILIIFILIFSIMIFAGENEDIINALKLQKLSQQLNLNENQIAKYIKMEENIKKINKKYMDEIRDIIEDLRNDIKKEEYSNADKVFKKINNIEKKKLEEINNERANFMKNLSNEQKAKMIIFEADFRRKLRSFLLENKEKNDKRKNILNKEER